MKKNILWRLVLIGVTVVLALVFFLPNTPVFQYMPDWWKSSMPDKGITLGLDLQGGVHLVFEVEGDRAVEITTERIAQSIKDILEKKKITADVTRNGLLFSVTPNSLDVRKVVEDNYPILTAVETGEKLVYKLADKEAARIKETAADQALETIRNRIDQFGVAEPTILRQGTNEIVVQLPGIKDPKRAIEIIGKTAQLEFKMVDDSSSVAAELPAAVKPGEEDALLAKFAEKMPPDDEILFEKTVNKETGEVTKRPILLKKQVLMTGDLLTEAKVT